LLVLSERTLQSITFSSVNALHSPTGVFAVDGTPVPEPAPLAVAVIAAAAVGVMRRRGARRPLA
jgi:hypothetical protein